MSAAVRLFFSPVKLNLTLRIVGRRSGLHLLDSEMIPLAWGDALAVRTREDGKLIRRWQCAAVRDADDLTMRAAAALKKYAPSNAGAELAVRKHAPAGAGLGGGSSNAAAALRALRQLWKLRADEKMMRKAAQSLGADVPFFLRGRAARARGAGEELSPLNGKPLPLFGVAVPPIFVSTAKVFAAHRALAKGGKNRRIHRLPQGPAQAAAANDLAAAAFALHPALAEFADQFHRAAGACFMTGSGGAMFAPLDDAARAAYIRRRLPRGAMFFAAPPLAGEAAANGALAAAFWQKPSRRARVLARGAAWRAVGV